MKRAALSSLRTALMGAAALSVAAMGTANADVIGGDPQSAVNSLTIWYQNQGPVLEGDPTQQALPPGVPGGNPIATLANQVANGAPSPGAQINFSLSSGPGLISDFLVPTTGPAYGLVLSSNPVISTAPFSTETLMEFVFTVSAGTLSVTHDDGVSLYKSTALTTDLFTTGAGGVATPGTDSYPTSMATTGTVNLAAGTYDLWYLEANGLPAILQTDYTPSAVPGPTAGAGLPGVALAGIGLFIGWRRRRRIDA